MGNQDDISSAVLSDEGSRGIVDHLHEAVYLTDEDRRLIYWNRAAEEITGYSAEEVVGSHCYDSILNHVDASGLELCTGHCPLAASLSDGERREAHLFLHHKSGHRVPVAVRVSRFVDPVTGEVTGIETFVSDNEHNHLMQQLEELGEIAYVDPLTRLPNRRLLEETLESRAQEFQRYGWRYGVAFVDIDHFKRVNDEFGHAAGDAVLGMVARSLSSASRGGDMVGRWGGEEFLVILSHAQLEDVGRAAERMRALVEHSHMLFEGRRISVTASLGAAAAEPGEGYEQLVERADQAMYASKRSGRNRCTLASA